MSLLMSISRGQRPAWQRVWWPAVQSTATRLAEAHRAQVALWEKVYAWPPPDGSLQWVNTVDGPQLRGWFVSDNKA